MASHLSTQHIIPYKNFVYMYVHIKTGKQDNGLAKDNGGAKCRAANSKASSVNFGSVRKK